MPRQEVTSDVDVERLLNVGGNEIVVTVPASGAHVLGCLRRQFSHALDRTDVGLLLGLGES